MSRLDVVLYKALPNIKTWFIDQVVSEVATPYDMTGKTVVLRAYSRDDSDTSIFEISPIDIGNGFVQFELNTNQSTYDEPIEYIIYEVGGTDLIPLSNGSITFVVINKYIPIRDIVSVETPSGVTIPESFITTKIFEWRLFLQNTPNPHIPDEDVNNELAWPTLYNFLIAKLVVNDYIVTALKGAITNSFSSSSSTTQGSGALKKLETGPASAEWYDTSESISNLLKVGPSGATPFQEFRVSICQLAQRLRVFLPMCGELSEPTIVPIKAGRPSTPDALTLLMELYG